MITNTRPVRVPVTPANLRSPVPPRPSISNRDWKLLETPVTDRKHYTDPSSNRDKIAPPTSGKPVAAARNHFAFRPSHAASSPRVIVIEPQIRLMFTPMDLA